VTLKEIVPEFCATVLAAAANANVSDVVGAFVDAIWAGEELTLVELPHADSASASAIAAKKLRDVAIRVVFIFITSCLALRRVCSRGTFKPAPEAGANCRQIATVFARVV
jgi:hypothetical protein